MPVCMHVHRKNELKWPRRCKRENCQSCTRKDKPYVWVYTCLDCGQEWIPDSADRDGQPFVLLKEGQ